jgi:hypothetical protein
LIPANLMSYLDSSFVIPACPESIFEEGLPTSGSDREKTLRRTFIMQESIIGNFNKPFGQYAFCHGKITVRIVFTVN